MASSWIPNRCQTLAAPATYALHYALGPPAFDWGKLKEPVRVNCRDETLQTLAEPLVIEDISFADLALPSEGTWRPSPPVASFVVSGARIEANQEKYYAELRREGSKEQEARELSAAVAHSLSGLALWPRLVLDEEAALVVESRGPRGEHRKSHWQTVLPLLSAPPESRAPAIALGKAIQLINILRDARPDAALNRVYLPEDMLREAGVSVGDVLRLEPSGAYRDVVRRVSGRAEGLLREAEDGRSTLPGLGPVFVQIIVELYREYLTKLRAASYDNLSGSTGDRVSISFPQKVKAVLRALLVAR